MKKILSVTCILLVGCSTQPAPAATTATEPTAAETTPAESSTSSTTSPSTSMTSQLVIEDSVVGTGTEAKTGTTAVVHYTGTLTDGTKFDSSLDRGEPFAFSIGAHEVIPGWEMGVAGMKIGGKRRLTIPGELAYGARGVPGVIPPNATLVFDIELLDVQ